MFSMCFTYYIGAKLLHFTGPPGAPDKVLVGEVTDRTAQLSWTPGFDNHSPITLYIIQTQSAYSIGWQTVRTGIVLAKTCQ